MIKVAQSLCTEWRDSTDLAAVQIAEEMQSNAWADDTGNLTGYRNAAPKGSKALVVLLMGTDRVTDAASLSDFHHCDYHTIWEVGLKRSFAVWTRSALESASVGYEDDVLRHFDDVLTPLVGKGLADLVQVSSLLDELDLSAAQDGRDAEGILLQSLGCFGLPSFVGFQFGGRRTFGPYVDAAVAFFSCDMFMEETARSKVARTLAAFREQQELGGLFEEIERKPFASDKEFVDAIELHAKATAPDVRARLLLSDFVTIHDRVLGFRPERPPPGKNKRPKLKKLSGGPIEVVLAALWQTLSEFKKGAGAKGVFAHEALRETRIEATLFKHDCDGSSADERTRRARAYIARLLGGVDTIIEGWLRMPLGGTAEADVPVHSRLVCDNLDCQSARTAEPCLQFVVELLAEGWDAPVIRHFAWRLPEAHPYRLVDDLFHWAASGIKGVDGYCLPVFHVPYYDELMLAKDAEETRRVLMACVQEEERGIFNLLGVADLDGASPLLPHIEKLAFTYDQFVRSAHESGIYAALTTEWEGLRKAYEAACDLYLNEAPFHRDPLATLLFRAFLIVQRRQQAESDRWVWEAFEMSGVVTVLHPALLEQLQAHAYYLMAAFSSVANRELCSPGARSFRDMVWQNYVDLAAMQMPLCGLLGNRNKVLDTNVRGEGLIHRVGDTGDTEAALTTRLLLRYDAGEDEEVSDSELFRNSRESVLIYRILRDYRELHPHAKDGLSIAVYQNEEIQPLISAVDQFLVETGALRTASAQKYALSITIFSESSDNTSVARWLGQWKERWESAESQGALAHYRDTRLSVAHRIVSPDRYYEQFIALIQNGLEVDIAFLKGFIGAGAEGNDFEKVGPYDVTARTLKFPILEKPFCSERMPGGTLQRLRVLSNRQFRLSTRHAEIMAHLKSPSTPQKSHHIVLGFGDFTPWQGVVDALHGRAEWVVCIDADIDERLVAQKASGAEEAREIIGFGSGVGSHGEANYTVSTEQFCLSDVLRRLTASVGDIYSGWERDDYGTVAEGVLTEALRLSGLSLVRATMGNDEHIRDFMAYAMTRKVLRRHGPVLCDQLVTLDAYRHWFDGAVWMSSAGESKKMPDLLWLVATLEEDGRIHLDMRLVECKLAKTSEEHLEKARVQIESGLCHLVSVFRPRSDADENSAEDERPDQRYWWLQLHRLIASKAQTAGNDDRGCVLTALESLVEGDYSIHWRAAAITFWTDQLGADMTLAQQWKVAVEGQDLAVNVVSAGSEFVRRICSGECDSELPWAESSLCFDAAISNALAPLAPDEYGEELLDSGGETQPAPDTPHGAPVPFPSPRGKASPVANVPQVNALLPPRILLGSTTNGARAVYWEFGHPDLSNRHMLIFGTSGMGKTYAIQCLLCELGRCGQSSLIVDYTNGFLPNQLEPETNAVLAPEQHVIRQAPLPISPFRLQIADIGGLVLPETNSAAAKRIAAIFQVVYDLGEQQFSVLYDALETGLSRHGDHMSLDTLMEILAEFTDDESKNKNALQTTQSKIKPFVMDSPFAGGEGSLDWPALFSDESRRCHIFQLTQLDPHTSRLVTEFALWDLYAHLQGTGSKDDAKVVVLDEVQNLDQREGGPLSKYLREGRKFGLALVMATQTMSSLSKDERDRMFNAGHKLFFRPADTEVKSYAEIAAVATGEKANVWMERLSALQKGECYSLGPSRNEGTGKLELKVFRIGVSSLAERGLDA
ncbi:MAG: ATP-binding protein [Lentisphaerae bacterium]|nr:ATP-binding protein [Lentisphaerota bacterium]MBT7061469.1 ATP-binding protein [Lentisphaerota bacterium]